MFLKTVKYHLIIQLFMRPILPTCHRHGGAEFVLEDLQHLPHSVRALQYGGTETSLSFKRQTFVTNLSDSRYMTCKSI